MQRTLLQLFLLLFSASAFSAEKTCETPPTPEWVLRDMESAGERLSQKSNSVRNTFPAKIGGKDIVAHYSKFPAIQTPSKGTIIALCGGPGTPCLMFGRPRNMPADYDVLVMDYLGIGENKKFNTPEMMAIESQGNVVSQLARHVNPKNLIIYGHSFGTAVATVAASKLTNPEPGQKASSLKGVFLEGVAGKAETNNYEASFARAAEKAWSSLNDKEKENLKTTYAKLSSELSPEEKVLMNRMLVGGTSKGTLFQVNILKQFPKMTVSMLRNEFKKTELSRSSHSSGDSLNQLRAAGCQLFTNPNGNARQKVFEGLVEVATPVPPDLCECKTVSKMWDPSEYQIKGVPLLYVNGKQDPNTAHSWALNHFNGQAKASEKVILAPELGGHSETLNFPLSTCVDDFFDSLVAQDISKLKQNTLAIQSKGCQSGGALTGADAKPGLR